MRVGKQSRAQSREGFLFLPRFSSFIVFARGYRLLLPCCIHYSFLFSEIRQ